MTRRRSESRPRKSEPQAGAPSGARPSPPAAAPGLDPWRPPRGDLAALLLAVPIALPFLAPGWFFGHDNMHLIRLFEQDVMIRQGHFPVRWYPDVAGGYGSPHPQYYAPLFYLLAQILAFAGLSVASAIKGAVITVVLLTSSAMHRYARGFLGDGAAVVAAAAYTYAPYHLLDLFVRTAFSEMMVFLFLPLVLLALRRLSEGATPARVAAAAAAVGGLCLAHTITVMLVPPLLGGYVALLARRAGSARAFLAPAGASILLGFGAAAFFLVPLVAEKGAVDTEIYARGYFGYAQHFVLPRQLVWSPWGFGLSREGGDDAVSFRLGLLQLAGCVLALLGRRRLISSRPAAAEQAVFAAALGAAGVLVSLGVSKPLWEAVPPLRYVQFPWRFLILPAFGTAFLCGAAAAAWARGPGPRRAAGPGALAPAAAVAIGALFAASSFEMIGFRKRIPLERITFGGDHTDMKERDAEEAAREPTVLTREFIRRRTLHWFDHLPPGGYPYPPEPDLDRPKMEVGGRSGVLEVLEEGPLRYRARVRAAREATLRLHVHRFPGWEWKVDGVAAAPDRPPGRRPVMTVAIPDGDHLVEAAFVRTPARLAGDGVSLASLAGIAALAAAGLRRRRPTG
jgi:hypothetical protein